MSVKENTIGLVPRVTEKKNTLKVFFSANSGRIHLADVCIYKEENDKAPKWVFPKNRCTPKSLILIGFSTINHPFWGTLIFGNTQMFMQFYKSAPSSEPVNPPGIRIVGHRWKIFGTRGEDAAKISATSSHHSIFSVENSLGMSRWW